MVLVGLHPYDADDECDAQTVVGSDITEGDMLIVYDHRHELNRYKLTRTVMTLSGAKIVAPWGSPMMPNDGNVGH